MKRFKHEVLRELVQPRQGPCVSIYLNVSRVPEVVRENGSRLRGLIDKAQQGLRQHFPKQDTRQLLSDCVARAKNYETWARPMVAMALFCASGYQKLLPLKREIDETVSVADSFHVKPLVRALQFTGRFQVLCVSQKSVRILEGDRDELHEITVAGVPHNIMEAMRFYFAAPQTTNARPEAVDRIGGGHKDAADDPDTRRFFRIIDKTVWDHVSRDSGGLPLILCAIEEYQPMFHKISRNPNLTQKGIALNPDSISIDRMREEAWKVIEPEYQKELERLINDFHAGQAHQRASDDVQQVARALAQSRVGTLIVDADKQIGGKLDALNGRIVFGPVDDPETDDVLDDMAEAVMRRGGQVLVLPHEQMPTESGLAAIYRY